MKDELAHLQLMSAIDSGPPLMLSPITMRYLLAIVAAAVDFVDAEIQSTHPDTEPKAHERALAQVAKAEARLKKAVESARTDASAWSAAPKGH